MVGLKYFRQIGLYPENRWINRIVWLYAVLAIIQLLVVIPYEIRGVASIIWFFCALILPIPLFIRIIKVIRNREQGGWSHFFAVGLLYWFGYISQLHFGSEWLNWRDAEVSFVMFALFTSFAYLQRLINFQVHYRDLSAKVVSIADNERQNLARELHDGIGQQMVTLKLRMGMAKIGNQSHQLEKRKTFWKLLLRILGI